MVYISIIRFVLEYAWHSGLTRTHQTKLNESRTIFENNLHKTHIGAYTPRRFLYLDLNLYRQDVKISLVSYAVKLKMKITCSIRSYPNEKLNPWLSETRIHRPIKYQLPEFLDRPIGKDLYQIVFQKDLEYLCSLSIILG